MLFLYGGGGKEKVMGLVYGLKNIKRHSFLNIWLQTRYVLVITNIGLTSFQTLLAILD